MNHRLATMCGRDPEEVGRASSPLELLFDLTFVVAFSVAGSEFAHMISQGHWELGLVGFGFACFSLWQLKQ